jgi:undecaprenyl-diphosphatase
MTWSPFELLYAVDSLVLRAMGSLAEKSLIANKFVIGILPSHSFKLLPIVVCLWLLWFSKSFGARSRLAVVHGVIGMFAAFIFARAMQNLLPERQRPLHAGDPNFVLPLGSDTSVLERWSSFPSDHAVIVFALSTAIWRTSRPLGAACYAWSTFVICFPRMYAGWHYASDVIAGALIGIAIALIVERVLPIEGRAMPYLAVAEKRFVGLFYAAFFVFSFQLATMFEDVRGFGRYVQWVAVPNASSAASSPLRTKRSNPPTVRSSEMGHAGYARSLAGDDSQLREK